MHRNLGWLLLAGIAATASVGCSSSQTISRGQSPMVHQTSHGEPCPSGQCHTGGEHHGGWEHDGRGYQGAEYGGPGYGPDGGSNAGGGCWPYKRTYEQPSGYRYPPANVPPTVVQYPYYTLRGPTDFFMK